MIEIRNNDGKLIDVIITTTGVSHGAPFYPNPVRMVKIANNTQLIYTRRSGPTTVAAIETIIIHELAGK